MYSTLIENSAIIYPEGLTRGLDNETKNEMFNTIISLHKAKPCIERSQTGMTIEQDGHILDHYISFFDQDYVYYYSQPYGRDIDIEEERNRELPEGWECIFISPTSWYYPNRCYTVVYRRSLDGYRIYQKKDTGSYFLWLGVKLNSFDRKERRLVERES